MEDGLEVGLCPSVTRQSIESLSEALGAQEREQIRSLRLGLGLREGADEELRRVSRMMGEALAREGIQDCSGIEQAVIGRRE